MKRICIPLLLVAALASTALGQQTDKTKPARRERAPRPVIERRGAEQGQLTQRLQKQMEDLRAAHQDLIADLRTLHATAVKEKATETAAEIDRLISRQQQKFELKMRQLEQYLYDRAYAVFIYSPLNLYAVNKAVNFVPQKALNMRLKESSVTDNHWSVRSKAEGIKPPKGQTK